MIKINLGCGWRDFGKDWIHIDGGDYSHLDFKDIKVILSYGLSDVILGIMWLKKYNYTHTNIIDLSVW